MSLQLPKIAVLLAAYNGMRWIEEQISSILTQSGVDLTIFVSIDPSSDGTEVWCKSYAAKHPKVVILPDAGKFGGASRNFFRLIRDVDFDDYEFIAFADQDDIWQSDKLLRAVDEMKRQHVDAYSSSVTAFWPNGCTLLLDKAQPQTRWDYLFEAAGPGCTYVLSHSLAKTLRASVLSNWLALQDVSLHDWYCYAFARSHAFRWYIDPRPSMSYRQHENNQVGANAGLKPLISRYKTIHEGWWFSQVRLIAKLTGQGNDPFVRSWLSLRPGQLIKLSFSASHCRRRLRDKVFFFFICWATALAGKTR
ncbi:glycosyltransferase family 2 protein [Pseudomonas jessenii]|uniref:Glycosyltransferase n=2 Tax=Pseudomonas TaxID=286 RepID=A0A7U9CTI9_PSEFL|nr:MULTISPECIES: glycosyltransferase family 2 protein [Pseudomonas]EJZ59360.1 Glycosyltransferase [Pseudomonas fluorescens R124]TNB94625.1 glycosyltransferase family 2 protein [Pseudomonas jessenii]